jgi:hypothetical protein
MYAYSSIGPPTLGWSNLYANKLGKLNLTLSLREEIFTTTHINNITIQYYVI